MSVAGRSRWLAGIAVGAAVVGGMVPTAVAGTAHASASGTLVGAWSRDWSWFDANVGPMQVYRNYDPGFHSATWPQTAAAKLHPQDPANPKFVNDYSFNLSPAQVADGRDDAELTKFIASTPKNIVLSNYHEPEQEIDAGQFTYRQFQDSTTHLAYLVHKQNKIDQGNRKVSVVLMSDTFTGFKHRNANNYWPTTLPTVTNPTTGQPVGENFQDLISTDAYALPHATSTAGVPVGYTDGVNWQSAATLLQPALAFANAHHTHWAISELGYLEDVHNPTRKANALTAVVNYASAGKTTATTTVVNPALFVEYWDSRGRRADWQLRYDSPVPSTSTTSNAAAAWRHLAQSARS